MSVNLKQELHQARQLVHRGRDEPGVQALLQLAKAEQEQALKAWTSAEGPALTAFQAKYNSMQVIIDFITKAPVEFKSPERI